eukprot:scpid50690/ scgid29624/ 
MLLRLCLALSIVCTTDMLRTEGANPDLQPQKSWRCASTPSTLYLPIFPDPKTQKWLTAGYTFDDAESNCRERGLTLLPKQLHDQACLTKYFEHLVKMLDVPPPKAPQLAAQTPCTNSMTTNSACHRHQLNKRHSNWTLLDLPCTHGVLFLCYESGNRCPLFTPLPFGYVSYENDGRQPGSHVHFKCMKYYDMTGEKNIDMLGKRNMEWYCPSLLERSTLQKPEHPCQRSSSLSE